MLIKYPALAKIERFFKLKFPAIIKELHWDKKLSIKKLSNLTGISRDVFQRHAKKNNLILRSQRQSVILTPNCGNKHWAWGKTKENSALFKKYSLRMKLDNPMSNNKVLIKSAQKHAEYLRHNPLSQEIIFRNLLDKLKVKYFFQYPINRYIIDFFISNINLCIEIDSVKKWGKTRRKHAFIKDCFLQKNGYKVLRIDKRLLIDELNIIQILKTNNII